MIRREHGQLGFMQLAIICGFSIFFASYLLSFFGMFAFFPSDFGFASRRFAQVLLFAGAIIGSFAHLAFCRRKGREDYRMSGVLHVTSFVLASALPCCVAADALGAALPAFVIYLASFLSGIAVSSGFSVWESLAARGRFRRGLFVHGLAFSIGGVIFLFCMLCLTAVPIAVACELFLALSVLSALFIEPRSERPESRPVKPAASFFSRTHHLDVVTYAVNAVFGFAFVLLYRLGTPALLGAVAAAVFVNLVVTLLIGKNRVLPFVGALRIASALVAVALVSAVCLPNASQTISLGVIVATWFLFRTVNAGSLSEMSVRNGFSCLYANIRGKQSSNIGFALGLLLGVGVFALLPTDQAVMYTGLALVAALILSALILLPFENESDAPGYMTLALVNMPDPISSGSKDGDVEEACMRLSERYKLSQRETEVLFYVAKGRNARHIAEKLYITESTAKTHMANIYRKVNVHSQQELMDLIDTL